MKFVPNFVDGKDVHRWSRFVLETHMQVWSSSDHKHWRALTFPFSSWAFAFLFLRSRWPPPNPCRSTKTTPNLARFLFLRQRLNSRFAMLRVETIAVKQILIQIWKTQLGSPRILTLRLRRKYVLNEDWNGFLQVLTENLATRSTGNNQAVHVRPELFHLRVGLWNPYVTRRRLIGWESHGLSRDKLWPKEPSSVSYIPAREKDGTYRKARGMTSKSSNQWQHNDKKRPIY